MACIAQRGDRKTNLDANHRQKIHEMSHVRRVVDEEIDIPSHSMAQVGTREGRAATEMARNLRLACSNEIENWLGHDPSIKGLTHGLGRRESR